jgi:hypothetical protein
MVRLIVANGPSTVATNSRAGTAASRPRHAGYAARGNAKLNLNVGQEPTAELTRGVNLRSEKTGESRGPL